MGPAGGSEASQRCGLRPSPGEAAGVGRDPGDLPRARRGCGMSDEPAWLDRLAHDLRGPLAPLQTASYLLQRDALDPARRTELRELLDRQTHRTDDSRLGKKGGSTVTQR